VLKRKRRGERERFIYPRRLYSGCIDTLVSRFHLKLCSILPDLTGRKQTDADMNSWMNSFTFPTGIVDLRELRRHIDGRHE
jgi:hypothetical protein